MYALTLWQPWAEIIALGWKLVENRRRLADRLGYDLRRKPKKRR